MPGPPSALLVAALTGLALVVAERAATAATDRPDALPVALGLAAAAVVAVSLGAGRAGGLLRKAFVLSVGCAVAAMAVAVVVGIPGRLTGDERSGVRLGVVAAGCGFALAVALRSRLERLSALLVHGDRSDPRAVLDAWAGRMTRALPLDELVLQLAEALSVALQAEAVEVWTGTDGRLRLGASVPERPAAELDLGADAASTAGRAGVVGTKWAEVWAPCLLAGREEGRVLRLAPVAHATTLLGMVVVERAGDQPLSQDEDRMLADAARRLGLALHNSALDTALVASLEELRRQAAELRASRRRVVRAADDAARRIERNLHDGAQQQLVTLAVKLSLARTLLRSKPEAVDGMLAELHGDVTSALDEVRTLAQGIYPPVLVERGLGEALRAAAERSSLPVDLDVRPPHPPARRDRGRRLLLLRRSAAERGQARRPRCPGAGVGGRDRRGPLLHHRRRRGRLRPVDGPGGRRPGTAERPGGRRGRRHQPPRRPGRGDRGARRDPDPGGPSRFLEPSKGGSSRSTLPDRRRQT